MTSIWVKVWSRGLRAKVVYIDVMISSEIHHLRVLHHWIVVSLTIIPSLKTLVVRIVVLGIPAIYLEGGLLIVIPRSVAHTLTYPAHVNHVTSTLILTHLAQLIVLSLSSQLLSLALQLLLLLLCLHTIRELSQKLTGWLWVICHGLISNHLLDSTI